MYRRASLRLAEGRDRFHPSARDHEELLTKFMAAADGGDLDALTDLLHEDVVVWNDGGGRTKAALRPVVGRRKVALFVAGLTSRYQFRDPRLVEVNAGVALLTRTGDEHQLIMIDVRDGKIKGIYGVLNPDKLARLPVD